MPKIKNVGDDYTGVALDGSESPVHFVRIPAGETAEVTDAKAEQLLADFPDQFKTAK